MKVDLDGIKDRVLSLPVSPGNYFGITAVDDKVYYTSMSNQAEELR